MNQIHQEHITRLFQAILTLKTADECYEFFEDACTIKELQEIAQRFEVGEADTRKLDAEKFLDRNDDIQNAHRAEAQVIHKRGVIGKGGDVKALVTHGKAKNVAQLVLDLTS